MVDDAASETHRPEFEPQQLSGKEEREEKDLPSNPAMTQHQLEVKYPLVPSTGQQKE